MNQQNHFIVKLTCVLSSILQKWKTILLVALIFGMGLDVYRTVTYKPVYSASLNAILKSEDNTYKQLEDARAYIKTLDYIFNDREVLRYVRGKMKDETLEFSCQITSPTDTNVVTISSSSSSRREAYESLGNVIQWYKENSPKFQMSYNIDVTERNMIPETAISVNNHMSNFKKGFMYSGIATIVIFALYYYFKKTIKVSSEIENCVDSRLFAKLPHEKKPKSKNPFVKSKNAILITSIKTSFTYKEAIRKLRTRVEESAKKHNYKTFLITSSIENEGKSSIAANLAISLTQNGYKVLLIDADFRKPAMHKIFGLRSPKIYNEYLKGQGAWNDYVEYVKKHKLFLMCCQKDLEHAESYVESQRFASMIQQAKREVDFVIIDTPPAYIISDAVIMNEYVDASLLVLRQNFATVPTINETISQLVNVKNNLIGCIYNASVIDLTKEKKAYGYQYGYSRYNRQEGRDA